MPMTTEQIDHLLERFDRTEPALQRAIVARLIQDRAYLQIALEELVSLHYDGMPRREFRNALAWMDRLAELGTLPIDHGVTGLKE